ncbi:hypothetical protein C1645_686799, partial [Glomus cerebriforme]
KSMVKYEGESMEWIPLILRPNEKEIILVMHNEYIFYSNNRKWDIWVKSRELPLYKKGNGYSIIVSEFLMEECGQLTVIDFPNCITLFAFDNSLNYGTYRSDMLMASRMNLKPEGKQPKMKDIVFESDNQHQLMVNKNNELKGMKQVLIKHEL